MRPTSKNVMTCMYPYQIVGLGDPAQELSREANLSVRKLPIRTDADSSLGSVPISTRLSKSGTEYKLRSDRWQGAVARTGTPSIRARFIFRDTLARAGKDSVNLRKGS